MTYFERFHQRLLDKQQDVRARPVTYVAFGDSVTQGCMEYGVIEHEQVYHHFLKQHIVNQYPSTILNVINAGVSGDTAVNSEQRWHRDLVAYNPDLITLAFGVNDCHQGRAGLKPYLKAIDKLIGIISRQTEADLLVLTPSMMMSRDNLHIHPQDRGVLPRFTETAESGYLQMYVDELRMYLDKEKIPYFDVYEMWEQMKQAGKDVHERLANGINHPDRAFHAELGEQLYKYLSDD
ncbi:SGNH/GDSL hydrolase family protein [Paenibacillaceae bacterium]|nr:SGNH/GDSL hydrolase family protein [Paenibacillaceae bacterium]